MPEKKKDSLKILSQGTESSKIAWFYGFRPLESPSITNQDLLLVKDLDPEWQPEEKVAIIREFSENKVSLPQPVMAWLDKPFKGSGKHKSNKLECELVILNSSKSICEGLGLLTARAILESIGWKNTEIRLNSVGNKDSVAEFERKMHSFIKKRINDFPPELKQKLKKDIFFLAKTKEEKYAQFTEGLPQSLDCLLEQSRNHLKEVLEFLETMDIPYSMDHTLMGDPHYTTDIVFEIVSNDGERLARGSRWGRLSKRLEHRREIPALSISISAKPSRIQKNVNLKEAKPDFYLIQFGPEAKLKSFMVLEKLRKAGVCVFHSLTKDRLMGQMSAAEQLGIPHIILIGQKEALEDCVIIRNTYTRSQISVSITNLAEHIKKVP